MASDPATRSIKGILAAWGAVAIASVLGLNLPAPPLWFQEWSRLLATVAVAAVTARMIWEAPKQIEGFLQSRSLKEREHRA